MEHSSRGAFFVAQHASLPPTTLATQAKPTTYRSFTMMGVSCRGASRLPAALRCYVLPARSQTTFSSRGLFSQQPHSALRATTLRPMRFAQMLAPTTYSLVGGAPVLGRMMATKASQRKRNAAPPPPTEKTKKPFKAPILLYDHPSGTTYCFALSGIELELVCCACAYLGCVSFQHVVILFCLLFCGWCVSSRAYIQ